MTIEQHYNKLLFISQEARKQCALETLDSLTPGMRVTALAERIADRATALAALDWPSVRSAMAAAGEKLPDGPLRYSRHGHTQLSFAFSVVGSNRSRNDKYEHNYAEQAYSLLVPDLVKEAEAAEAEFKTYRKAVELNVAVAPAEDK